MKYEARSMTHDAGSTTQETGRSRQKEQSYFCLLFHVSCFRLPASCFLLLASCFIWVSPVHAEDKTWKGSTDATDFFGDENWYPSPHPVAPDNATINAKEANVKLSETFNIKSITLGGNEESTLTTDEFISGTIAPNAVSDIAILNRRDGHLVLKGPGTVKAKGAYKDSEENLTAQPSLVFSVQ